MRASDRVQQSKALIPIVVALVVALSAAPARANAESDADAAFRAASELAVAKPDEALVAFERLGGRRPITRWTDNAWSEAARLAERQQDYTRARAALAQVIAVGTDEQLIRRARATLERLDQMTGQGAWDEVARKHEELTARVHGGGDPRDALDELAALVRANPGYPRALAIRMTIAHGWEVEDEREHALRWLRDAAKLAGDEPGQRTRLALARMLIRDGELAAAENELAALAEIPSTDRGAHKRALAELETARTRTWIRRGLGGLLLVLAGLAAFALRRDGGSWRAAARRIARPPLEVLYLAPIAIVIVVIAYTGSPIVADSVLWIAIAGVVVAWISGAILEGARTKRRLGARGGAVHVASVVVAIGCAVALAVEHNGVIDLLVETWRGGHALR